MGLQVQATQVWLNNTYGAVPGWVGLDPDGVTGWQSIYGLGRALQHEFEITPLASGFGPATTAAFQAQVGQIDGTQCSIPMSITSSSQSHRSSAEYLSALGRCRSQFTIYYHCSASRKCRPLSKLTHLPNVLPRH